jgi:hypothetical protein
VPPLPGERDVRFCESDRRGLSGSAQQELGKTEDVAEAHTFHPDRMTYETAGDRICERIASYPLQAEVLATVRLKDDSRVLTR